MKKNYWLIGMLSTLAVKGQNVDTVFQKKILPKTDIEVLFSYYSQDGDNSAVTGGTGTEKLSVYAPNFSLVHTKANHSLNFSGGVDVITSASTDNIDFVMSSASRKDSRLYAHAGYSLVIPKARLTIGGETGFSIESDYFSWPLIFNLQYTEPKEQRSWFLGIESYLDDLRWGRVNPGYYRPVKLIYPVELRYKEWFDEYRRNTFTFKAGFTQVVNHRMMAGISSELSYQHGLLATPFHRVYFNNDSLRVENLPGNRFKIPIGIKLNYFIGARTILKGNYNFYSDSWGILANAFQVEAAFKINPKITLSPFCRIYHQSAADYFKPYKEHDLSEIFYTSDYDLSRFTAYKFGFGFGYTPLAYAGRGFLFDEIELRYAAYFQSTKLQAHSITLVTDMNIVKEKKRKNK